MMLPNSHLALIEREKVAGYLLNPKQPDNGGKAAFFVALGFSSDGWETLADALRKLVLTAHVSREMETGHGIKYIVEGEIEGPLGKTASVRTIWIVDAGTSFPRLVTAYPYGR
jgi:hypothetical protein